MHHSSSVSHTSEKPRAMCTFSYNIFMNTGQDLISGLYGRTSCLFRNKEMMSASGRLNSTLFVKVSLFFFCLLCALHPSKYSSNKMVISLVATHCQSKTKLSCSTYLPNSQSDWLTGTCVHDSWPNCISLQGELRYVKPHQLAQSETDFIFNSTRRHFTTDEYEILRFLQSTRQEAV